MLKINPPRLLISEKQLSTEGLEQWIDWLETMLSISLNQDRASGILELIEKLIDEKSFRDTARKCQQPLFTNNNLRRLD